MKIDEEVVPSVNQPARGNHFDPADDRQLPADPRATYRTDSQWTRPKHRDAWISNCTAPGASVLVATPRGWKPAAVLRRDVRIPRISPSKHRVRVRLRSGAELALTWLEAETCMLVHPWK